MSMALTDLIALHVRRQSVPKSLIAVSLVLIFFLEWRRGYFSEPKAFLKNPFPQRPRRLLFFALASLGILGCLFAFDSTLLAVTQSFKTDEAREIVQLGSFIGRNTNFWLILVVLYFLGYAGKGTGWSRHMFGAIVTSGLTGVIGHGSKYLFLRARPSHGIGPYSFLNLEGLLKDERDFQSFPSGDMALVAGVSCFCFFAWGKKYPRLRWLIFLLPLSTAFARVSLNRHWPSDTFGSVILCLFLGREVWNYHAAHRS